MLIYEPYEKFLWHKKDIINDGGQQFPNYGLELANLELFLAKDYKTGEVLAHSFGPDTIRPEYTYIKGELAEAYSGKVKSFMRSFVFLNLNNSKIPAALFVFDRVVTSRKDFKKYWLLHCVEEPVIDGNITSVMRRSKGYNGKLVNTTLLPYTNNLSINKIGGKGNEYSVFNKQFPQSFNSDKSSLDGASWRIEVTTKNSSVNDNFLNVMQVMDYEGGPVPHSVFIVNSDNMVGAMIADRIVLFSNSCEKVGDKVRFTLSGKGTLKVLITDLKPGFWKIEKSGETALVPYEVTRDGGVLYFYGTAGKYTIVLAPLIVR